MTDQNSSSALMALMRFAKQAHDYDWRIVAKTLEPLFFAEMSLIDVVSIVVGAYEEGLADGRFTMGNPSYKARELLLSPIKGSCSIDLCGRRSLETQYRVEQIYNSFLKQMLSDFRLAQVDWCAEYSVAVVEQ